ncbi:MAG: tetratricopeptide repeat protein [Planctomycetaceae bacterium]
MLTTVAQTLTLPQPQQEPEFPTKEPEFSLDRGLSRVRTGAQLTAPDRPEPLRWHGEPSRPGLPGTPNPIPPERMRPRQKFAVCVGIDHYAEGAAMDLRYAAADAVSMAAAFLQDLQFTKVLLIADIREVPELLRPHLDSGRLGFTNDTAASAIERDLETFARLALGNDDVLAYYHAGHGDSGRTPALLAGDHTQQNPRRIMVNAIIDRLQAPEVFAAHRLIILDTCRSGLNDNSGRTMSAAFREAFSQPDLRMTVLTGCDSDQCSIEDSELEHGRFTWALLEGIRGPAWRAGEQALLSKDLYVHVAGLFGTKGWNTSQAPQQFQSGSVYALAWRELPLPQQLDEVEQQKLREDIGGAQRAYLSVLTPQHRERARSLCRYALRAIDDIQPDLQTQASRAQLMELYGLIEYRLGNHQSAGKWLADAALLNPDSATLALIAALRQADEGHVVAAFDQLQPLLGRLAETAKDDIWLWQRIAGIQSAVGDSMGAIASYGRAAEAVYSQQSDSQLRYDLLWLNLDRQEEMARAIWADLPFTGRVDWVLAADEILVQTAARTLGPDHGETKRLQWQQDAHRRLARMPFHKIRQFSEQHLLQLRLGSLYPGLETSVPRPVTGTHTHFETQTTKDALDMASIIAAFEQTFLPPRHPWTANATITRAFFRTRLRQYNTAINELQQALDLSREHPGPNCKLLAECCSRLGDVHSTRGMQSLSDKYYKEAAVHFANLHRVSDALEHLNWLSESALSEALHESPLSSFKSGFSPLLDKPAEYSFQSTDVEFLPMLAVQWFSLGQLHLLQNQRGRAADSYARAEKLFYESGHLIDAAEMLGRQGDCWRRENDEKAAGCYSRALRLFRHANVKGQSLLSLALAQTLVESGRFEEASALYDEVIRFAENSSMLSNEAWSLPSCLRQKGNCWATRDDEKAIESFSRAMNLCRSRGEHVSVVDIGSDLAEALFRLKRFDQAIPVYSEVAIAAIKLGDAVASASARFGEADCFRQLQRYGDSIEAAKQCLQTLFNMDNSLQKDPSSIRIKHNATVLLGKVYVQLQRDAEAAELFQQASKAAADDGRTLDAARMAAWAGDAFFRTGNSATSADCFAQAAQLHQNPDLPNPRLEFGLSVLTTNPYVAREEFAAVRSSLAPQEQVFRPAACLLLCLTSLSERGNQPQQIVISEPERELLREAVLTTADGPPRNLQVQQQLARLLQADTTAATPLRKAIVEEILKLLPASPEIRQLYKQD